MSYPWDDRRRRSGGGSPSPVFPPPPTREQVCRMRLTFQGLVVETKQFGRLPWFEPAIMCLDLPEDRQAVYAAKRAAGDRHLLIEFSSTENPVYHSGVYFDLPVIIKNCETIPDVFLSRIEEAILAGFQIALVLDGDDADNQYGDPNARRQLPILVDLLRSSRYGDLNRYVLYCRFWDGVFYGSSPEHIASFGTFFRELLPNGYLAIEHQTGRIPVGGGAGDWAPSGPMSTYDVLCSEFDYSNSLPPSDNIWQIACRLLGPKWVRPADCPDWITTAYATQHWYLGAGSPRGPYYAIAFEWEGAEEWVHWRSTTEQEAGRRAYLSALGYGDLTG